jgi:hypothetical protein
MEISNKARSRLREAATPAAFALGSDALHGTRPPGTRLTPGQVGSEGQIHSTSAAGLLRFQKYSIVSGVA